MPTTLPNDVWLVVFDQLIGDPATLALIGNVSRSWRHLSLPALLADVDLSCHLDNNGRQSQRSPYESWDSDGRLLALRPPPKLVSRQRAFLRLLTDRPELGVCVKALTWTLVWAESPLTDLDLRTWEVFSLLHDVKRLDLASFHNLAYEPYIRQNPAVLFPAVSELRLGGWMHRGLVRAIVTSLDSAKLVRVELDHLQDEGALPDGSALCHELAEEYRTSFPFDNGPVSAPNYDTAIDDDLWARQEQGLAAIFPGPMWFPLRLLRKRSLDSLSSLHIRVGRLDPLLDTRNYLTLADEIAGIVKWASNTLTTISISLGENPKLYYDPDYDDFRPTQRRPHRPLHRYPTRYRRFCFFLTTEILLRLLAALTDGQFHRLAYVALEGFCAITSHDPYGPEPVRQAICECPYVDESLLAAANVEYRPAFPGYYISEGVDPGVHRRWEAVLENS